MALPPRKFKEPAPKKEKRESRWKSQAHLAFVRSFHCAWPGCQRAPIEAAHVRNGSGAGMSQKPDDWRAVPLCGRDLDFIGHHQQQHQIGEQSFWRAYQVASGQTVDQLIESLCDASPRRQQIREVRNG
ncbi:hypothetical protein [Novosphingobium sp. ST904]|uniref:hypothetical protein n=1 Tax=Novosphingobium sp. ST904 TaxID=1684385 RepID=UPI0006C8C889|nr:hypothetical protein [Novosphingobium sp. ST904]KPH66012.1 hypothetical protein ADT71_08580 [Novosphingobium sp. ST904]TCM33757.1 hypothetical protein EDF59_11973 [Novosphingobium sp. ST904]